MSEKYNKYAGKHMVDLATVIAFQNCIDVCEQCRYVTRHPDKYCSRCGAWLEEIKNRKSNALIKILRGDNSGWLDLGMQVPDIDRSPLSEQEKMDREDFIFPSTGIYIYFHPHEGYKIGQAENVLRRMEKHLCSAPSSELLHVIETSDLNWCERFLHNKFRHRRIHDNHEYFWLTIDDLDWLFSIKVLEPPRNIDAQMSLLDLL